MNSKVRGPKSLLTAAMSLILAGGMLAMAGPAANAAGQAPALGAAANFAVLAGTAVTCTGGTITGNVGVFPGTAITQTSCPVTGTINAGDLVAAPAQSDFVTASNGLATQTCEQTLTGLSSLTLASGVYCFDAAATQTGGVLTLDGPSSGIWIFKIGTLGTGALTGTGFSVVMTGGGQASNVYWHVAQATTMTDSHFLGTILAGAGITMTRGTFDGRALANAAVTITGTAVSGFAPATPTPTGGVADPTLLALITDDDVFSTADLSVLLAPLAPFAPLAPLARLATNSNGTQHYGPFASGSGDSSTCGPDWANDLFNRVFTVRQTGTGTFTVVEQFKNGTFVTTGPESPGACDFTDGTTTTLVSKDLNGTMHGYEIISVTVGTQASTDPSCIAGIPSAPCTTLGFLTSHFTGLFNVPTFFFHYAGYDGTNQMLIEHEWKNASADRGGNHGDIATQ